jgi:hypothetical protein
MAATAHGDELDGMVTTTFHTFQALTVSCIEWASDASTARSTGMPKVFRLEAQVDGQWQTLCSSLDHIRGLELDLPKVLDSELPLRDAFLAQRRALEAELAAKPAPRKLYAAKPKAIDQDLPARRLFLH